MFRKQLFSIRKFSVGAASVCVGLFLGGQIVNADSLPTENPATVAVSNQDVQAEVAAPAVTENSETGGVDGSETTSTTTIIEPIAKVIIIGSQPAPVEETPVDEPAVVTPVDEPQVDTLVEDSIITAKGDSVTHELPELDITAVLSQGHILPTEILPETIVTLTVSHLVSCAAAGGSAEATSILSQGTGNTEQSAKILPNTGKEDALTSLGLVVGMLGFGFVKRKKAELD